MLKIAPENNESDYGGPSQSGGSLLDEIVRDGARQMLAAALQAEVPAYITPTSSTSTATGWWSVTATTPSGR